MRPMIFKLSLLTLAAAWPSLAPAAAPVGFQPGDRVLVEGSHHRKCSAKVSSLASGGAAWLSFDRFGCGDAAKSYPAARIQRLRFVEDNKTLRPGDDVVLNGFFNEKCHGRVREVSKSGYANVDFDALLCAETEGLRKTSELTRVTFVKEALLAGRSFQLGDRVVTKGIHPDDDCAGRIEKLTDNGLAMISFEGPTCAYAGKLYPLSELSPPQALKTKKLASGANIFNQVMREIASAKKAKQSL